MTQNHSIKHLFGTLGLVVLPLSQGNPDPFGPGLRWVFPAPATDLWIPCDVAFAGAENLVWASAVGGAGRWSVLDASGASVAAPRTPHFEDSANVASITSIMAVAGERADALYGMRQEIVSGFDKRTEVFRYDALAAAGGASFAPVWTYTSSIVSRGPARIDTDQEGAVVVLATFDPGAGLVEIVWIDGSTGLQTRRVLLPGNALDELRISANGRRVALAAGLEVYVFDGDGNQLKQIVRTAATPALALSSTGRVIAIGGDSRLDVWVQDPSGYHTVRTLTGSPIELASRVAISADGSRLALAWWDRTTGVRLRLETWDLAQGTRLINVAQNGTPGGLQNVAEALSITPDGRRVALGTWGLGGPEPEVQLFDVDDPDPVFSANLPGSVHELALDRSGTRLAVAYKDAHANQFSFSGGIRFFDTGERELQLEAPTVLGGQVQLTAAKPGAGSVLFLIGTRARRPTPMPGIGGAELFLNPSTLKIFPRRSDSSGRADWAFRVPNDPTWVGIPFSVQAAFRIDGATELSSVVLDPLVLNP